MNQAVSKALEDPAEAGAGTVEMPEEVLVRCPLVEFNLWSVAKHCQPCKHFHGAADRFPGGNDIRADKRYLVLCGEPVPVKRELFRVVD